METSSSPFSFFYEKEAVDFFGNYVFTATGVNLLSEGHSFSFLSFVLKGELKLSIATGTCRYMSSGHFFLIPCNTPYQVVVIEDLQLCICRFSVDMLLSSHFPVNDLISVCKKTVYDFQSLLIHPSLMLYISLLDDYLQHGPFDTTFLALKKQELFYLLFNCYSQDELSMLFHPLLGEDLIFKEFIQTHFLKVRSVNELASLAHYSTSGFIKRFRRCFNESPYRWIARKKSERICSDIISGRLSFQEIAYQYKFSSYARFVDFCKTQIGFLPSEISEGKHSLLQQKNILKEN